MYETPWDVAAFDQSKQSFDQSVQRFKESPGVLNGVAVLLDGTAVALDGAAAIAPAIPAIAGPTARVAGKLGQGIRNVGGKVVDKIKTLGTKARGVTGRGEDTVTGYRYMTQNELQATQKTELLRGGRSGETFFTKDVYKSQQKAQERLALPRTPTHRVEFKMLNNPAILRNGTKIRPNFGMRGGGSEFMTNDRVRVQIINWQSLR